MDRRPDHPIPGSLATALKSLFVSALLGLSLFCSSVHAQEVPKGKPGAPVVPVVSDGLETVISKGSSISELFGVRAGSTVTMLDPEVGFLYLPSENKDVSVAVRFLDPSGKYPQAGTVATLQVDGKEIPGIIASPANHGLGETQEYFQFFISVELLDLLRKPVPAGTLPPPVSIRLSSAGFPGLDDVLVIHADDLADLRKFADQVLGMRRRK